MTLTIDLSPEQESRLRRAGEIQQTDPETLIRKWVDCLPDAQRAVLDGPSGIRFGMFPQLRALSEEDFSGAEWRGDGTNP